MKDNRLTCEDAPALDRLRIYQGVRAATVKATRRELAEAAAEYLRHRGDDTDAEAMAAAAHADAVEALREATNAFHEGHAEILDEIEAHRAIAAAAGLDASALTLFRAKAERVRAETIGSA